MAERLNNSGFWRFRFLITPEEFETWISYMINNMKITLYANSGRDSLVFMDTPEPLAANYRIFYDGLMSPDVENRLSPFIRIWLKKDGFNNSINFQKMRWYFDPPQGARVSRDFYIDLISPKGYQVNDPDGKHYEYHDIHEIEPLAKNIFDELTSPVKKITKPLYADRDGSGKLVPEYQIRISKQAWADLVDSAFIRGPGQKLRSKW